MKFDKEVLEIIEAIKEPTKYKSIIEHKQRIFKLADFCERKNFYKENKRVANIFLNSFNRYKSKELNTIIN